MLRHNLIGDTTWCRVAWLARRRAAWSRSRCRHHQRGETIAPAPPRSCCPCDDRDPRRPGYPEARERFRGEALWDLVDGDRERLNLARVCRPPRRSGDALRIQFATATGRSTTSARSRSGRRASRTSSGEGVGRGDRVAIMLEPSLPFYGAVFGTVKRGASPSPLHAVRPRRLALRIEDCRRACCRAARGRALARAVPRPHRRGRRRARRSPAGGARALSAATAPDDLALFQYTSGTTRALPEAVRHTHRSVVTLMVARSTASASARVIVTSAHPRPRGATGSGTAPSPPLALGIAVGSYSGSPSRAHRGGASRLRHQQPCRRPDVYRMIRESGAADARRFAPEKLSLPASRWTPERGSSSSAPSG